MIKETLSQSQARDIVWNFSDSYKYQFSYYGFNALFDYMEQYSEDMGEDIEFDFIAWCCEFTEYADFEAVQEDYPDIKDLEELQDNTTVIEFNDDNPHFKERKRGIIIQAF